jgi:hypothetical protein
MEEIENDVSLRCREGHLKLKSLQPSAAPLGYKDGKMIDKTVYSEHVKKKRTSDTLVDTYLRNYARSFENASYHIIRVPL